MTSCFAAQGRCPLPLPIPDLGRAGSEGGDAGYGAVTAPSRPALMMGTGFCINNCGYFRNEILNDLMRDILFCSTGPAPPPPIHPGPGPGGVGGRGSRVWRSYSTEPTSPYRHHQAYAHRTVVLKMLERLRAKTSNCHQPAGCLIQQGARTNA